VIGYDVSERVVDALMAGTSHIQDVPSAEVAAEVAAGRFSRPRSRAGWAECDAISIAVPTPLSKTRDPDMAYVLAAARRCSATRTPAWSWSSRAPRTRAPRASCSRRAWRPPGLTVGEDVFLAFSPSASIRGTRCTTRRTRPRSSAASRRRASRWRRAFYGTCIDTVVPVSSPEAAELVKLLENTFRAVNIGLVNEIAIMCDKLGVDVWEVIEAAATKPFGFMKFTPGPGIGGHCIPLDPHYLAWKMRTLNYKTRFIDLASEINSAMPDYVVDKVARALNERRKAVRGSRLLVLGVAYKRDIDDVRESPALDIIRLLEDQGAHVEFHDPHVAEIREDGRVRKSVELSDEMLRWADGCVVVTDHRAIDWQRVVDHATLVVDTRHVLAGLTAGRAQVVSLASSPTDERRAERRAEATA
jgi:UDP-N-acetyl-D-glucosamine dehydrogenase